MSVVAIYPMRIRTREGINQKVSSIVRIVHTSEAEAFNSISSNDTAPAEGLIQPLRFSMLVSLSIH